MYRKNAFDWSSIDDVFVFDRTHFHGTQFYTGKASNASPQKTMDCIRQRWSFLFTRLPTAIHLHLTIVNQFFLPCVNPGTRLMPNPPFSIFCQYREGGTLRGGPLPVSLEWMFSCSDHHFLEKHFYRRIKALCYSGEPRKNWTSEHHSGFFTKYKVSSLRVYLVEISIIFFLRIRVRHAWSRSRAQKLKMAGARL